MKKLFLILISIFIFVYFFINASLFSQCAITVFSDTTICAGDKATLTATGMDTYLWNPGILNGDVINVYPVATTTYTIVGTDTTLLCSDSATITVTVNPLPNANAGPDQVYPCNTSFINIIGSSSSSNVVFSWATIGGSIVSGGTNAIVSIGSSGQYFLTVIDTSTSCFQTDTMFAANTNPTISLSGQTDVVCFGDTNGTATTNTTGGTAPFSYLWSPSGDTTSNVNNLIPGVLYIVTVTDANNCTSTTSIQLINPPVLVLSLLNTITPDCGDTNGSIFVTAAGGVPGYIYTWEATTLIGATLPNIPFGLYTGYVTDNSGCVDTLHVQLDSKESLLSVPQFISPNGDGYNDIWIIPNLLFCYPDNKVKIYSRWGNELYSAAPYNNDWEGIANISYSLGKNVLPTGTYFFIIDLYGDGKSLISNYIEIQK